MSPDPVRVENGVDPWEQPPPSPPFPIPSIPDSTTIIALYSWVPYPRVPPGALGRTVQVQLCFVSAPAIRPDTLLPRGPPLCRSPAWALSMIGQALAERHCVACGSASARIIAWPRVEHPVLPRQHRGRARPVPRSGASRRPLIPWRSRSRTTQEACCQGTAERWAAAVTSPMPLVRSRPMNAPHVRATRGARSLPSPRGDGYFMVDRTHWP